ncbi:MAG: Hpt domain-containing protein [Oscillospiraceae bacterium]|jgi:HPt (histidine-containing phosphotransfer) domain-containing protein|nr:Hpt domain-containing protein [Oscillospiraceae bacterium]
MSELTQKLEAVPGIDAAKAVQTMGSENAYERVLRISVRMMPGHIDKLNAQFAPDMMADYSVLVHGLKGALRSIGAFELGDAAYELETLSKDGKYEACEPLHAAFVQNLGELVKRLEELLGA